MLDIDEAQKNLARVKRSRDYVEELGLGKSTAFYQGCVVAWTDVIAMLEEEENDG